MQEVLLHCYLIRTQPPHLIIFSIRGRTRVSVRVKDVVSVRVRLGLWLGDTATLNRLVIIAKVRVGIVSARGL